MRKLIGLAVVIALLSFVGSAYGAIGVDNEHDGSETYVGEASNINFEGQEVSFDGSKVTVLANGHKDGVTDNVSSESNLLAAALNYGVIRLGFGSAKSISIAAGTPGQMVTIVCTDSYDEGAITLTDDQVVATSMTTTGWDDIAFDSDEDTATLLWIDDTIGWVIVGQANCTIT